MEPNDRKNSLFLGKKRHFRKKYNIENENKEPKPVTAFIPNILTLCGMCCGITGIHMAINEHCIFAIITVLFAIFFDGIDGRVARKLEATSRFGAELDSLSDFATFGITPAICVYVFALHKIGNIGWTIALLFAMSMALRLARFNVASIDGSNHQMFGFATGVPAPAGAYMLLWPLMIGQWLNMEMNVILYAVWAVIVAGFTISRIPTFLLKSRKPQSSPQSLPILLLAIVAILGMAYSYPWFTAVIVGIFYIFSIFISVRLCNIARKNAAL
ncbi:MAG: phosphatidylcholine/phosphatidylserine synthase [Holosporales bacterium]|jgi:CDP-diacylglycerol--serine O-phosphatidyltransferase|nr:phosphatidylcholine/phosphatidylserine synthase [Holosporales bacterium]